MNTFKVGSFQLVESKKWAPAGILMTGEGGSVNFQEIEFGPEHRFNTKEEADNFFRQHYTAKGYTEKTE
jgi:hypothetical protein